MPCPKCIYKNGALWQGCVLHHIEYDPGDAAWDADCRAMLREIEKARDDENRIDEGRLARELLKK